MPNLHFLNFLRPVETVTDKLIRASPYHGCRVRVIAFCLAFPVHSFDCLCFDHAVAWDSPCTGPANIPHATVGSLLSSTRRPM
jgi:hypothetical protein